MATGREHPHLCVLHAEAASTGRSRALLPREAWGSPQHAAGAGLLPAGTLTFPGRFLTGLFVPPGNQQLPHGIFSPQNNHFHSGCFYFLTFNTSPFHTPLCPHQNLGCFLASLPSPYCTLSQFMLLCAWRGL